jgi:apolipoprotein N-acyltransferase
MQLASLTGIWGITFLVAWGASATNAVWEGGWSRRALLYGGARLAAPLAGPTAQVAALAPSRELWSYPPVREIAAAASEERQTFSERAARAVDDLFARTSQAAAAGAQIVVWAETAAFVPEEDAPAILERAAALARREGVYLQVGPGMIRRTQSFPFAENRAVLFAPDGRLVWEYHKARLVPIGDAAKMTPGQRCCRAPTPPSVAWPP